MMSWLIICVTDCSQVRPGRLSSEIVPCLINNWIETTAKPVTIAALTLQAALHSHCSDITSELPHRVSINDVCAIHNKHVQLFRETLPTGMIEDRSQ